MTGSVCVGARAVASVCVVGLISIAAPATAQVAVPGQSRQDIDPASRTAPVEPALIDPSRLAQPGACPFTGKGEVTLRRIEVVGATLLGADELQASVSDLTGSARDLSVLCTARDRVAALYAQRGEALVRVDLPEQRISDGVLSLKVTEGRIVGSSLGNAAALGPASRQATAYLAQLEGRPATRWGDVERALLLTQEIPGAQTGFAIRRADDGTPDALVAVANFAPRRLVDLTVSAHNLNSPEIGRAGGSVRADINSLTALAERTSLIVSASRGWNQRVFQLVEEVRIGGSGLVLAGDLAFGRTEPEGALEALALTGKSLVGRIGARYPLVRRRAGAVDLAGRLEFIRQDNALGFLKPIGGDLVPLFEEDLRVLAAEASGRWSPAASRGLRIAGGVELRKGLSALGASERDDPLLSRPDGRPDFTAIRLNASVRQDFLVGAVAPYVALAASGQWAPGGLPAYEEFQVGNYTVGRGYDPGAASGDRAAAAQFEAGLETGLGKAGAAVGLFGFFDTAKLWNEDPTSYDRRIASLGGGVRLRARPFQLGLTYAKPQRAALPGGERPDERVLLSLSTNLSIR